MKNISKIGVLFLVMLLAIIVNINTTQAATISSNIDGIREDLYPGYKEKIKQLQAIYPNIKVLYTGLECDDVIKNVAILPPVLY